jgi:MoaE-MoaD fusion protein
MHVRVIYFAAARELAGCASEELRLDPQSLTLREFVSWLGEQKPRLAPYLSRMRCALNGDFAELSAHVKSGDEVVVMPPVAGGSALAEVRDAALSVDEVITAVRHPSAGGIAVFMGVVRDHHQGKPVARLDYEAYRELADKEMRRIVDALTSEHAGTRIAVVHRVGELAVGDLAVVVAVSAAHRGQAFDVCRLVIDRVKDTVPVWKKEWAPDGSALWVNLVSEERT